MKSQKSPYAGPLMQGFFIIVLIGLGSYFSGLLSPLWSYLAGATCAAFYLCGMDKKHALRGSLRVPEVVLFFFAFIGGSVGLLIGMKLLRHKTKKGSFQIIVVLICIVQLAAIRFLR